MKHSRRQLLLRVGLIAMAGTVPCLAADSPAKTAVYVGTYTDPGSRGIYRFSFDPASGAAGAPALAAETTNPSFLALHPNGRFLYAVNETDSFEGRRTGFVSAFAIDGGTGTLKLLDRQPSAGAGPCHLIVDRTGRNLLVANYGSGTVALLRIAPDGRLAAPSAVHAHQGSGPNRGRQAQPHAHGIYLDAAERFALSPDLGADRIFVYRFDGARGTLEPHGTAALDPGSGPRHLAFDPSGRRVYSINELLSTLTGFAYDPGSGALQPIATVSTLPSGYVGSSATAEVALSTDGRFLYGSNRGHDSLAVFRVERDGRLTPIGQVPVGGRTPRHFAIDPSGGWLLVAQQDGGAVAVFRLDPASGMPQPTGVTVAVPKPVCLVFAR